MNVGKTTTPRLNNLLSGTRSLRHTKPLQSCLKMKLFHFTSFRSQNRFTAYFFHKHVLYSKALLMAGWISSLRSEWQQSQFTAFALFTSSAERPPKSFSHLQANFSLLQLVLEHPRLPVIDTFS